MVMMKAFFLAITLAIGFVQVEAFPRNCLVTLPRPQQNLCQNCRLGFWNDNGRCRPCRTHGCRVCQPPDGSTCTQCLPGFTLENGNCNGGFGTGEGDIDAGVIAEGDGEEAVAGDIDEGSHRSRWPSNCQVVISSQPWLCQNCYQGFWNDNGVCRRCRTPGCRVCQPPDGSSCTQCKVGYQLVNGNCNR